MSIQCHTRSEFVVARRALIKQSSSLRSFVMVLVSDALSFEATSDDKEKGTHEIDIEFKWY